jgi:protein TonB
MKFVSRCGSLVATLALAACQPSSSPSGFDVGEIPTETPQVEAPQVKGTAEELRQRAALAVREQRVYAPAGDNAVEYFLAARRQLPGDADVRSALVELQPYLLIATEQALERLDIAESDRLLALIARVDSDAPALPRLRLALRGARERKAREAEQAAGAAEQLANAGSTTQPVPPGPSIPAELPASPPAASAEPAPLPAAPAAVTAPATETEPASIATTSTASPPPRAAAVRTPRLLQDASPRYPLPALRGKVEGQAEVAFTIQPDGSVRNVQLLSSSPAGMFDNSAVAVAARWRFEATGQAHASRRTVLFRLPN